jgi:hypothetical protein
MIKELIFAGTCYLHFSTMLTNRLMVEPMSPNFVVALNSPLLNKTLKCVKSY